MSIEAMKLALDAFGEIAWSNETQWQRDRAKQAITSLRQAIEQAEQAQPMAYQIPMKNGGTSSAWIDVNEQEYNSAKMYAEYKCRVLYTAPPPRQWVSLTEEEKGVLVDTFYGTDIQRLEAIEAKLKEKNT